MINWNSRIDSVVSDIKQLHGDFVSQIDLLKSEILRRETGATAVAFAEEAGYWRLVMLCDSLVKVRIFIERNFHFIETIGLLGLIRYMLELSIWCRLCVRDLRYALVYHKSVLEGSQEHYSGLLLQLTSEISLFKRLEKAEGERLSDLLQKGAAVEGVDIRDIRQQTDDEAALVFSIYGEDAKHNGYGFQAYLLEAKALPQIKEGLRLAASALADFDLRWGSHIVDIDDRWNWKRKAAAVGMDREYDFIYAYTSRLLHAKPASLTTDQKSLELAEVYMFLRYCSMKIKELLFAARNLGSAGVLN